MLTLDMKIKEQFLLYREHNEIPLDIREKLILTASEIYQKRLNNTLSGKFLAGNFPNPKTP